MRSIHITGQARSGTTLMKNLMHCFEDTIVIDGEHHPCDVDPTEGITVTKFPGEEVEYLGVDVICMVRDPRDAFCSRISVNRKWVDDERRSPGLFVRSLQGLRSTVENPQTLVIKYEELVSDPDRIQTVIAERFNLTICHPFSRGHELFSGVDSIDFAMNGVRPPDTDSIGAWRKDVNRGIVKQWLRRNPEILEYIQVMGYEEH